MHWIATYYFYLIKTRIVKFFNNKNSKWINQRRWLAFKDRIVNTIYKIVFEHIKSSDDGLADKLSRCIFLDQVIENPPWNNNGKMTIVI